jgi:enoyl-CoA hydratase/carnithine racemase
MPEFILTQRRGKAAIITLSRSKALNAWHRPMREELIAAIRRFEADPEIGAIVLTGAGDAFSAGQIWPRRWNSTPTARSSGSRNGRRCTI